MAPSSTNRGRRRVVLLPLPYQGHINPMLRLAAALHSRGLAVTILHPETRAPDRRKLPADYRLVTIPDNIPPELTASGDVASFVFTLNKNCAEPFRDYLAGALREEEKGEDGRVAFVVADVDWFAPLSVARELGVAALGLMTSSAARFLVYLAYPSLCRKGYLPVQESNFNTAVEELPPFVVQDLHRVMDMTRHLAYADLLAHIVAGVRQSSGLIINTSQDIEGMEFERIRSEIALPVFAVGPLHMMTSSSSVESSLLTEDRSCLDWLDTQRPNSVLYVSFGSLVGIDTNEFLEIAWGLADSQRPFVWVVRPRLVHDCESSVLPGELQQKMGNRGRIVSWAPQQEVLRHPSVAAFLTHCGWNSTTESISEGYLQVYRSASGSRPNLPPGPWALPVVGHMHFLLGALPHQAMRSLSRRHGPVMLLRLGHVPTLVLSSAEAARQLMKVHDAAFANRPVYTTADVFTNGGQNISFARHDTKDRPEVLHPLPLFLLVTVELLSPRRVRSFRPVREEEAARLVRSVADAGALVDVGERVKVMMNDVIMRVSVGDRCQQRALYLKELDRAIDLMSGFNLTDLFPTSRLARVLGSRSLRATWEVHGRIQSIMDAMVHEHKMAMGSEEASAGHEREDILTTLLRFQRDGGMGGIALTNENVSGVLFDVFSAGSETTATTTIWAMSELIRNPRIMAIAQSEVRRVLQGKTKVAEADIDGRLHYLQMVIKETFRLHPPVPLLIPRLCTEQRKIMGFDVPPGTTVFANVWAIGRDEKSWTDAEEFKPERFESEMVDYGGTSKNVFCQGQKEVLVPHLPILR
ncbi:dolabradiene monooxygenase [Triticum aestivum]|uniref:dolabradiene monooxygenase n=1 Tax=Triticum aestivum TaxID=4565 RepID=UPI001D00CEBC|nr:dolabradiene monooxygenase-like [Triticum aestivum]